MKYGILLVAFGSGNTQGKCALGSFEDQVRKYFPGVPIRWAFTSNIIRRRLAKEKEKTDSLDKALTKMAFEQFSHIALQPLHVISGMEYSDIVSKVNLLRKNQGFPYVLIGEPLLTEDIHSVKQVTDAILSSIPEERKLEEPVLFMGHGNKYLVDDKYIAISNYVREQDPLVFIGTMNGSYRLEHILAELKDSRQKVWLIPLLAVVGRHVLEDMVGEHPESWKTRIEAEGFTCIPVLKGMADKSKFVKIWLDHLAVTMHRLISS